MHEQAKIDEAKYFLAQMTVCVNDRVAFNFNLSAFLAAARSALQYALKEAKPQTGGQAWYDAMVAGKPAVRFFKDKRDISIHANPVLPSATIEVSATNTLHLSDSFSVTTHRKDGTEEELTSKSSSPQPPLKDEATVTYQYFFTDWSGHEDVLDLCESYITDVESIVSDGVANGFLTA